MLSRRSLLQMTAAGGALWGRARADSGPNIWPTRPVRIISPFAAGGTSDLFARILADHFSTAFKQPFFTETRAGAGGLIGSAAAQASAPDGYTLLLSGNASHVVAPAFAPVQPYDGVTDFTHIAYLGGTPVGLLIHPSLPVNSYGEFLAYVKASPNSIGYTSSGAGTHGFLFGEELAKRESLRLKHIPYKGGAPAMIDLLAGHVKVATITFSSGAEQVRAGKLKALAVSSEQRLTHYPDIPTFAELGRPDQVSFTWFALSGPRGMPRDIVDRLNRETAAVLQLPLIRKRLEQDAIQIKPMSPDEVTAFVTAEIERWAPLARGLRAAAAKAE